MLLEANKYQKSIAKKPTGPQNEKPTHLSACPKIQQIQGIQELFALRRDPSNPFISIFYCFQKLWKLHKC